ncbi:FERRICHROME-IRON RECEPTOR [Pseudoalteromonas luteoviolacea B = ATCC 29581]|nr:FERRICHROME-IRON RECEPTOR [Pseudoalteromonas luteoviolacea B = ATCC 29581]
MTKLSIAVLTALSSLPAIANSNAAQIEKIEVQGTHVEDASSLLRNGLDVKEVARSVHIIDKKLLEEIRPKSLENVITFTSNASFLGSSDGRETSLTLRGFQKPPILIDGFRVSQWGGVSDPEIYGLEQVEILKGPDSILFGEANPGGIVNMRAKRPSKNSQNEVIVEFGSDGYISPRVDVGGELSNTSLVRVIGLYKTDDTHRNYTNPVKRAYFAPSAKFMLTDTTTFTVLAEITKDDNPADFGNVLLDGKLLGPIGQVNNGPDDTMKRHLYNYGLDLTSQLSAHWQLNARARSIDSGYEYSVFWMPAAYIKETNQVMRVPANQINENKEMAYQLSLSGDIDIGTLRNRIVVGADHRTTDGFSGGGWDPKVASMLDWNNPDYSQPTPALETLGLYRFSDEATRYGVFVQNHLSLTDALLLSAGIRHDSVERKKDGGEQQELNHTSAQLGLTYAITDDYRVYSSYSESFSPNTGLDKFNQFLAPEQSEGMEIGIKGQFNQDISFTLAYFDITKQNVAENDPTAQIDPNSLNPFGQRTVGEQTANGAEIDLNWQISTQFSVFANYGYADHEIVGLNAQNQKVSKGKAQNTPNANSSIWLKYDFEFGHGFNATVGGGLQYTGERYISNDVTLDSYTLVAGYFRVEQGPWQAQLNIQNATDERYVAQTSAATAARGVQAGKPRAVIASIAYRF